METPGSARSPGRLHSRIELLEAEVTEKQQNLIQAAMYGNTLLEENADLRDRIDNLMKQHAAVLEDQQQELCTVSSRLEVAASTEKWQQEELSTLRCEVQNAREQQEEEKRRETAAHRKEVHSLQVEVDHHQAMQQTLRSQVRELEALLASHLDRNQVAHNLSASFTASSEEMAALAEDMANLRMDLTEAQARGIEVSGQLEECRREKAAVSSRHRAAVEEMEDLQCQASAYCRHLEESRKEVVELRAQLDASRVGQQVHNSKGNSIFSELEDRRVVLERMMSALKVHNEQLKEKYNIEKQQNSKYKMQIAMALQMTTRQDDPTAQRLREQLSEAHSEIRTLMDKLQQLESSKDNLMSAMAGGEGGGGGEQFFLATLQIEKVKATKAHSDLQAKQLQYLDVSQKNVDLSRLNRQLEAERDKSRAQTITLLAQKDALLSKYEPDKVKGNSNQQKSVIEKIDLGDAQIRTQDPLFPESGRPSSVFKPSHAPSSASRRLTSAGSGSALKPMNALPIAADAWDVGPRVKTPGADGRPAPQKENVGGSWPSVAFPSTGRCVKMSEEVEVIYADGDNSITALAEEKEKTTASLKKQRPAKTTQNVKCVKANEAPELQCKTQ